MKKRIKSIGIFIGVLLLVIILGFSFFVGKSVFENVVDMKNSSAETSSMEVAKEYFQKINFDIEDFQSKYQIQELEIPSTFESYKIPALYIKSNESNVKGIIVMVHGLGGNRWTNCPVGEMFLNNGYDVITYDQRNAGDHKAKYHTFGYFEKNDLKDLVTYSKKIIHEDQMLGTFGFSMGSETIGLYLGTDHGNKNLDFAILDSSVDNMKNILNIVMEDMNLGLPLSYLLFTENIYMKMKLGFTYKDTDVPNALKNTTVPVLVIHSEDDQLAPYWMGENIYKGIPHNNKKLYSVKDSKHVEIYDDNPMEYERQFLAFEKMVKEASLKK
ncbi:MAG: alpha/beta hydrolase [Tissierellia bacterium]|nr:alpha/beta hydrolase [Tissierellia bacterium]